MRLRTVPVVGTMPSLFGNSMASYVLNSLAGQGRDGPVFENRNDEPKINAYQRIMAKLMQFIRTEG
jgi:hypothetical protein